ncbi:MAG: hypothetical protein ACMXYF_02325 [Candidatus Woesearchaeota archaeon]
MANINLETIREEIRRDERLFKVLFPQNSVGYNTTTGLLGDGPNVPTLMGHILRSNYGRAPLVDSQFYLRAGEYLLRDVDKFIYRAQHSLSILDDLNTRRSSFASSSSFPGKKTLSRFILERARAGNSLQESSSILQRLGDDWVRRGGNYEQSAMYDSLHYDLCTLKITRDRLTDLHYAFVSLSEFGISDLRDALKSLHTARVTQDFESAAKALREIRRNTETIEVDGLPVDKEMAD